MSKEVTIKSKMIKKIMVFGMVLFACLICFGIKARATGVDMDAILGNTKEHNDTLAKDAPIVAFGADLSADQRASVLNQMGLTEGDLANYKVLTITNAQEHQYLDAYLDSSVIGTKALSCVKIVPAEAGHGVMVTTKNITYCTTGMYRNALLTAGVQDADILVVGPSPISGTAGLIGAIKAYETMSGEAVSEQTLDTAMNELITTGEIAEQIAEIDASGALSPEDAEKVEQLIAYVKAKVAAGDLDTEEDIKEAIAEGEEKFGVKLSDDEVTKIISVMNKIKELGIDPNFLVQQAEDMYKEFGPDFVNHLTAEEVGKRVAGNAVKNFFSNIGNSIKNFFSGLFG